MNDNEVTNNDFETKTSDVQSDDILAKIEEIINGTDNISEIIHAIEDIKAENGLIKRGELATHIIKMSNEKLDEVYWVETIENFNRNPIEKEGVNKKSEFPILSEPISLREIILSQLIGKPYPSYLVEGVIDFRRDGWTNDIRHPREEEMPEVEAYKKEREERKEIVKDNLENENERAKGKVKFGYHMSNGITEYNDTGVFYHPGSEPNKMECEISISREEMILAGLDPEKMDWKEERENSKAKINSEDIAKLDKKNKLTTTEIGLFNRIINKIRGKSKEKGEQ